MAYFVLIPFYYGIMLCNGNKIVTKSWWKRIGMKSALVLEKGKMFPPQRKKEEEDWKQQFSYEYFEESIILGFFVLIAEGVNVVMIFFCGRKTTFIISWNYRIIVFRYLLDTTIHKYSYWIGALPLWNWLVIISIWYVLGDFMLSVGCWKVFLFVRSFLSLKENYE